MTPTKAISLIDNYFEVLKNDYFPQDELKQFPLWRKGRIYKLRGVLVPGKGLNAEVMLQRATSDNDDDLEFIEMSKFVSLFGLRYPDEIALQP